MKTVLGDLIDLAEKGEFDIILHGCNCFCAMGSGLAKSLRNRYPEIYIADCKTVKGDQNKLGTWTSYDTGKFIILNAYTQYAYGGGKVLDHFEYDSFDTILDRLAKYFPGKRIGFPQIGAGLAGGSWPVIYAKIEKFANIYEENSGTVTIVELG